LCAVIPVAGQRTHGTTFRALKVTSQVATPGVASLVNDCLVVHATPPFFLRLQATVRHRLFAIGLLGRITCMHSIDAAYCCRCSVVCVLSVYVCLLITTLNEVLKRLNQFDISSRCAWTVQSHSPVGASVHLHLIHASELPVGPNGISVGSSIFAVSRCALH